MATHVENAEAREAFNASFQRSRYEQFLNDLNTRLRFPTDFRISETPLFLSEQFAGELLQAADDILRQLKGPAFLQHAGLAVPPGKSAPGEDLHPQMLQIDFGITLDEHGNFIPQLIELQGFPSLYCFQSFYEQVIRDHFAIPPGMSTYFNGLSREEYIQILSRVVVGEEDPAETILLEIQPELQKTRIDFAATEERIGVRAVCVTSVQKRGRELYYMRDGREVRIRRIYNRVVFDELERKRPPMTFSFQDDLDVTWIPHPNWFFKISKHTLPFLTGRFVPSCTLVSELDRVPGNLSDFVLKPLFSFAGSGVIVDVTEQDLLNVNQTDAWVLQKKVQYAAFVPTEDEPSKAEIRLMFLWNNEPLLVTNLVRMSKGKMMGVDFNKNRTWVGSSAAYCPV